MTDDKKPVPLLTRDQVVEVLQVAATYDRRTIGDTDVIAWAHAAKQGRWAVSVPGGGWSNHAAIEGVRHHYATSTAYLMPGHITDYMRGWRRQPPPVAEVEGLIPAAPPATAEARQRALEEFARRRGLPKDVA